MQSCVYINIIVIIITVRILKEFSQMCTCNNLYKLVNAVNAGDLRTSGNTEQFEKSKMQPVCVCVYNLYKHPKSIPTVQS